MVKYSGCLITHKRFEVQQLLIKLVMSKYFEDNLDPALARVKFEGTRNISPYLHSPFAPLVDRAGNLDFLGQELNRGGWESPETGSWQKHA